MLGPGEAIVLTLLEVVSSLPGLSHQSPGGHAEGGLLAGPVQEQDQLPGCVVQPPGVRAPDRGHDHAHQHGHDGNHQQQLQQGEPPAI